MRRLNNRVQRVEEEANPPKETVRRFAWLLLDDDPTDPDRPHFWKDEEALEAWIDQLPSHHLVTIIRPVNVPPEPDHSPALP